MNRGTSRSGTLQGADQRLRRRRANMGKGGGVPCPHRERWHCVRVGFGTLECAAPVAPAMPNVSVNWGRFIGSGAEALRSAVEPRLCETAERAEAGRQRPLTPGGGEGGRLVGRIRQGTPSGEIRHSSSPPTSAREKVRGPSTPFRPHLCPRRNSAQDDDEWGRVRAVWAEALDSFAVTPAGGARCQNVNFNPHTTPRPPSGARSLRNDVCRRASALVRFTPFT